MTRDRESELETKSSTELVARPGVPAVQDRDAAVMRFAPWIVKWANTASSHAAVVLGYIQRTNLFTSDGHKTMEDYLRDGLGLKEDAGWKAMRAAKNAWSLYPEQCKAIIESVRRGENTFIHPLPSQSVLDALGRAMKRAPVAEKAALLQRVLSGAVTSRELEAVHSENKSSRAPGGSPKGPVSQSAPSTSTMPPSVAVQPTSAAPQPRLGLMAPTPFPPGHSASTLVPSAEQPAPGAPWPPDLAKAITALIDAINFFRKRPHGSVRPDIADAAVQYAQDLLAVLRGHVTSQGLMPRPTGLLGSSPSPAAGPPSAPPSSWRR